VEAVVVVEAVVATTDDAIMTVGNQPQPQPVTVTVSAALSRVIGHIHGTQLDASRRSDVLHRLDRHIDESSRKVRLRLRRGLISSLGATVARNRG
jgi:hypothetical protein